LIETGTFHLKKSSPRGYDAIIIIGIQPLGLSRQRPELSQATGMALVRCMLGKFLGVVCHCFPPRFGRSHFRQQVHPLLLRRERSPAAEGGTMGENIVR
jgi:hypothetical protein